MNSPDKNALYQKWGSYKPHGLRRLISFIVSCGLSHGPTKKKLTSLWFGSGPADPVDLCKKGVKFRLFPVDNVKDFKMTFGSAYQDSMELKYLKKKLNPDSIFVDIGANIGYYSCIIASHGVQRILAVEPHPQTLERLRFNLDANSFGEKVQVAPFALGEKEGSAVLNQPTGNLGASTLLNDPVIDGKKFEVNMLTLKSLCDAYSLPRVDAIKIDVEGLEDKVLIPFFNQAPESLWPRHLILENGHKEDWAKDVFSYLKEKGYRIHSKNRSNSILTTL